MRYFVFLLSINFLQSGAGSDSSIFTAEEEIFAFQRTTSRLIEMQTERYWKYRSKSNET